MILSKNSRGNIRLLKEKFPTSLPTRRVYILLKKEIEKTRNVYVAFGQTDGGRYLVVFFILKKNRQALILSARDMTRAERRKYAKK